MKNIVLDVKVDNYRLFESNSARNNDNYQSDNLKDIEDFIKNSIVDATAIMKRSFPNIKSDIFISYSRLNYCDVEGIANMIKKKYNWSCFIDSDVWKYYEDIIDNVKDEYEDIDGCEINKIRDNVDIMLATSLMNVMNKSKIILLFNTDKYTMYQNGEEFTYSPWIYHELCCAKLIDMNNKKDKQIKRHINESIKFKYTLNNFLFDCIKLSDFLTWLDEIYNNNYDLLDSRSIDLLYNKLENKSFIN